MRRRVPRGQIDRVLHAELMAKAGHVAIAPIDDRLDIRDGIEGHEHACRECPRTVACWDSKCPTSRRSRTGRLQSDAPAHCQRCKHGNEEDE